MNEGLIGEYERHHGTIAMFPFRNDIWRENAIHMQEYMFDLVTLISRYEHVYFFCPQTIISTIDFHSENVTVIPAKYDDIWARDIGPTFTRIDGKIECVDWKFNAWGGKKEGSYFPWDSDDKFASVVSRFFNIPCHRVNIVLEGGSIISDGIGTIFSTRSVLLNRNRNPFIKKNFIEKTIIEATHDHRIVWIAQGLAQDETNGHIDNIMAVVNRRELCLAWTDDKKNPNYYRVRSAYATLSGLTNLNNEEYIIHLIPLPPMQYIDKIESQGLSDNPNALSRNTGGVLPASYLNYYLINGAVLIPSYNCEADESVRLIFKNIFPDRDVLQVYSREPLLGGGGIHCVLHEVPLLEEFI
jgi:agmatine deiminase